jgi:hypothetical protein
MKYVKIRWIHSHADEPVLLYSELNDARFETRKIEVFADGHCDHATATEEVGTTRLGVAAMPAIDEIAQDPQFEPSEITKEEFESVWRQRGGNLRQLLP